MPKSTKKKKDKTADFAKPKLKLGKGKRPATNTVDTSFKARSIALPYQSISTIKDTSAPTTKRNLTFDDLLGHLKHYNANVRKDALQGLHELLDGNPALLDSSLLSLINSCVRLIADEDASVRRALYSFLSWLIRRMPQESLAPHAPTILLFTASAQTSIFPEIRIDSVRIIDLLLERIPKHVVAGSLDITNSNSQASHGRKILEGYLGLLNVAAKFGEDGTGASGSTTSTAGPSSSSAPVMLSPMSKSIVLESLSHFLRHAASHDSTSHTRTDRFADETIPLWFFSNSFKTPQAFNTFSTHLTLYRTSRISKRDVRLWGADGVQEDFANTFPLFVDAEEFDNINFDDLDRVLLDIERISNTENAHDDLRRTELNLTSSLCRALHSVLVSAFLDCAPAVFSPTQACSEAELELVFAILEIGRSLYGRLLRDMKMTKAQRQAARGELGTLLGHMAAYFPFGENCVFTQDMKTEAIFQNMNLVYCELFSLLSVVADPDAQHGDGTDGPADKKRKLNDSRARTPKPTLRSVAAKQAIVVREYVVRRLRGSASTISVPNSRPMGYVLTVQAYVALLPTFWWLLCQSGGEDDGDPTEVLSAILQHSTKAGSSSGVKVPATQFVARLLQLQGEPSYTGQFHIGPSSPEEIRVLLREWLLHLPKVLWELADKSPALSEFILLFLLRTLQRRSWLNTEEVLVSLRTRLCPFFTIQHASRGEVRGPYAKLKFSLNTSDTPSNPLKRLALDVVVVLISSRFSPTSGEGRPVLRPGQRPLQEASVPDAPNQGEEQQSKAALRIAVEKVVTGTDEESYWRSVSIL